MNSPVTADVFHQLARLSVADKDAALLSDLIRAQTTVHPENPRTDYFRGELARLKRRLERGR